MLTVARRSGRPVIGNRAHRLIPHSRYCCPGPAAWPLSAGYRELVALRSGRDDAVVAASSSAAATAWPVTGASLVTVRARK